MPQLLRCPRGHRWEPSAAHPAVGAPHFLCPVCGAGHADGTLLLPEEAAESDGTMLVPAEAAEVDGTMLLPAEAADADGTMPPADAGMTAAPPADGTSTALPSPDPGAGTSEAHAPNAAPRSPADSGATVGLAEASRTDAAQTAPPPPDPSQGTAEFPSQGAATETPADPAATVGLPDAPTDRIAAGSSSDNGTIAQAPPSAAKLASILHGVHVPGYEILSELGRGGMGVVYKARQVGLNRLVALKMILAGGHAGERELARFRVEAEAIAKLQHPHIVQVYEIDTADGRPYFCLEFVDGGPLDKKLGGDPQPFREAAELVRKLAEAMDYAHRRHIIHRDLKPANVLLTTDGSPKVTDFGLAKKLDEESSHTQSGSIMGTPSYMAPEQAQGRTRDIGPAADIYSLGAILYETLVGRPPFKGQTILETLEQVGSQEPTPPSRLRPKTPHDLETICLKCLQKGRSHRYATAGDLAEDLRRFVRGEPILARPTPLHERAWKWVRRHPIPASLVAVSVLFVLSLIAGGVAFGVYQQAQAHEQGRLRGLAEAANLQSQANFQQAEENYKRARSAVDQMLTEVGQERLAREPRMEKLRRELLTRALDFYKRFLDERGADPAVRRETARAYLRVGDIHEMLGEQAAAEQAYDSGRTILTDLRSEFPDDARYRQDLAVCLNNLGGLFKDAGRTPEAEQAFRDALALRQRLVDDGGGADDRRELAAVGGNLGVLLLDWGRYAEAETLLRQSLRLREEMAAASADPAARLDTARGQDNLGLLLAAVGRGDEAEQAFRKAIDVLQRLKDEYPAVPDYRQELAVGYIDLGNLWRDTKPVKAEEFYRQALALRTALVADFPTVPVYRQEQAAAFHSLGFVLQAAGRQDDADEAYGQAMGIEEKLVSDYPTVPDYPFELAGSYNNRGILLHTTNRLKEAEKLYDKALALLEKLVADHKDAPAYQKELADALQNLGVLCQTTHRPDEAGKLLRRSLDLRRRLADAYPKAPVYRQDLASAQLNLGVSWQMNGHLPEAEACYRDAVNRFTELAGQFPQVPDYRHLLAAALNNLGNLLRDAKRPKEAEQAWRQAGDLLTALSEEEPAVPSYRQEMARGLNEQGIFLASAGRSGEAEKAWKRVLELQEKLAADFPS